LSSEDRAKKLTTLTADKLAVEREEEHWISDLISSGMNLERRTDADARAVLGVQSDVSPDDDNH
jgi:hypothetical protein